MNRVAPKLLESVRLPSVESKVAPSLERRRLRAYVLMLAADALVFNISFALASLLWESEWAEPRAMLAAQVMLPAYFTIALYNRTYGLEALVDWLFASRKAVTALLISAALINFIGFYTKSNSDFSRASVTIGLIFTGLLLVALRRLVALFIARRWNGRVMNRLVIEDGGARFPFEGAERISAADFNLDPSRAFSTASESRGIPAGLKF